MEFKFEEHIAPMRFEMVQKHLSSGINGFLKKTFRPKHLDELLNRETKKVQNSIEVYNAFKTLFELIQESANTKIKYEQSVKTVSIKGSGHHRFKINRSENTQIRRRNNLETGIQTTSIPLLNGEEEFRVLAYEQLDLGNSSNIEISYNYQTQLELKCFHYGLSENRDFIHKETSNPLKTSEFLFLDSTQRKFQYKEDDKLSLNVGNVICDELCYSIFGEWIFPFIKREKLHIEADIFKINPNEDYNKIYSGEIRSNGAFPFLISKNPNTNKSKQPSPVNLKELIAETV